MKLLETFLKLTEYTYGFGEEHELLPLLPTGLTKDQFGNYFLEIGENSETMFCAHLDTVGHSKEKVEHKYFKNKINGNTFIGTDGSTILGADDKSGVVILMNLIEKQIPGLYYFFLGEEIGAKGSRAAVALYPDLFKKYKRCIAFDRRDYGSIISKQMGDVCCSQEFVSALSAELSKNGMKYQDDPTGIFTDSAIFMETIPECTNLSVGYFYEHSHNEIQNYDYLRQLAQTVTKINWESLPVVRVAEVKKSVYHSGRNIHFDITLTKDQVELIFLEVSEVLSDENVEQMKCINIKSFGIDKPMIYVSDKSGKNNGKKLTFIFHKDGSIEDGKEEFMDYDEFEEYVLYYYTKYKKKERKYLKDNYLDDDFVLDYLHDEDKPLTDDFLDNFDISEFLFDITQYSYEKNKTIITLQEMEDILEKYNKTLESLIVWLIRHGNDPDKTYGLTYDKEDKVFNLDIN